MKTLKPGKAVKSVDLTSYALAQVEEVDAQPVAEPSQLPQRWSGVIAVENKLTGDGRMFAPGALSWSTPIPLRFVLEDRGAHDGAVVNGRILEIERQENGNITAHGDFDLHSEVGREAARLVRDELMNGISVDLDAVTFEVRLSKELYEEYYAPGEEAAVSEEVSTQAGESAEPEKDEQGRVKVHESSYEDEVFVITSAVIRAATIVSTPAFIDAMIFADKGAEQVSEDVEEPLVASAAPIAPPLDWFTKPELDEPTALTITDEGQVYGHLATWDICHIADPAGSGVCVMAPKNASGYKYFHTGAVKTEEGVLIPTGSLRFDTGHASLHSNAADAAAHYDNTGFAGADVHAVDGKHGIWIAGALRPQITPEQIRILRASPLSGDWRYIEGNMELVGALAVNLPGFPIPRTQGMVASGEMTSMVAAGMLPPRQVNEAVISLSKADAGYLARLIERERTYEQRKLAQRVRNVQNRRKVVQMATQRKLSRLGGKE